MAIKFSKKKQQQKIIVRQSPDTSGPAIFEVSKIFLR
jgi:hypothetical protein